MLTTREIAVVVWLIIAGAFVLSKRDVRSSLWNVLRISTQPVILAIAVSMTAYVLGIVLALRSVGVWSLDLMKDTIVWFLFGGIPLAFSSFASRSNDYHFLGTFLDTIRVTVLVEFLVNEYTFSLPAELVFVPVVTMILMLRGYASAFEEYSQVHSILGWMQGIVGLAILAFVVSRAIGDIDSLLTMQTAQELLLAPVLCLLLLPFVYAVLIYLLYERLFVVLKAGRPKGDGLLRYAKRRLLLHLKLSVAAVRKFHSERGYQLSQIPTRDDVDRMIAAKN